MISIVFTPILCLHQVPSTSITQECVMQCINVSIKIKMQVTLRSFPESLVFLYLRLKAGSSHAVLASNLLKPKIELNYCSNIGVRSFHMPSHTNTYINIYSFFFLVLLRSDWHVSLSLRGTTRWFDLHMLWNDYHSRSVNINLLIWVQ